MRMKGKVINWNSDKAFGFIEPNGGGEHIFIHKTALANRKRVPEISDIITFSLGKDKQGRYCATEATFSGEKVNKKQAGNVSKFSIIISFLFLAAISLSWWAGYLPIKLLYAYWGLSTLTLLAYANDKIKAKKGAWRTKESTLHLFALLGGWPGAAFAQQLLRHKSQKREFRMTFWVTTIINICLFTWLNIPQAEKYLAFFN
jgi:uncharacterized membrane protein YsdA (DUF1294 family)/cold shock CspA family protein